MSEDLSTKQGSREQAGESGIEAAPNNPVSIDVGAPDQDMSPKPTTTGGAEKSPDAYTHGLFKRHMKYDPLSILFAILVFVGGLVGYITKQSAPSLIAGSIFAVLLAAATFYEGARKNPYPLLVILFALGAMMGYRAVVASKFMPSGLVATLAFIMLARHVYMVYLKFQDRKRARL